MLWNLIGTIGGKVLNMVEDKDEANKLKFQIQRQLIDTKRSELEVQTACAILRACWLRR